MASNSASWMNKLSWPPSSGSTENPFDDRNGDPFDDLNATPLQNIEASNTAHLSTETQQQNDVTQSGVSSSPPNIDTVWGRFNSKRPSFRTIFYTSMLILVLWVGLITYTVFHIKWHTQPYLYSRFLDKYFSSELVGLLLIAIIYLGFGFLYCLERLILGINFYLEVLNGIRGQNGYKFKPLRTFLGGGLITCFILGLYIMPAIGILIGPDIQWYNQMKDSCNGFGTRVQVGTDSAASKYDLYSFNASIDNQTFYLAPVFTSGLGSNAPFRYFHRFSENTANTANYAIDVDIDNGVWRELHFNETDELTKLWTIDHKKYGSTRPISDNIAKTASAIKLNGTFITHAGHLWMPDFDLIFQGLEDARKYHEIEPFIRVFDTRGFSESRIEKLLSPRWDWDNRWDPSIVMRTASFGHGRQRLDMCVKENYNYTSSRAKQRIDGVSDGSILPLAVIAAFRKRMKESYMFA